MISLVLPYFVRLIFAMALLSFWSCALTSELDVILGESPRGTVYLERIPDRTLQAAQPTKIAPQILDRVLRGIMVKEDQGLLRQLSTGPSNPVPAFTDEEVRFLAPLLSDGLRRAASDQQIGFRLSQSGSTISGQSAGAGVGSSNPPLQLSPPETTTGFLYAYEHSLHIALLEYRRRPERAETINMPNRYIHDATGLMNRTLFFTPESANRMDSYRGKHSDAVMFIVDYELIAMLPVVAGPISSDTTAQPVSPVKEGSTQKDTDIEALRKELQELKRKIAEQEAERNLSPPKKPVAPRGAQTP